MMAQTHLAFGLLFALILAPVLHASNNWLFFSIVLFCALLPDIDHPQSKIGRKIFVSKIFNLLFGHRGFFHAIWIPLALGLIVGAWLGFVYGIAIVIGYVSHLFSDGLTKSGINMIHPINQLRMQGFVETGGIIEWLVFVLIAGINAILLLA